MLYSAAVMISSTLEPSQKQHVVSKALQTWSFLCLPVDDALEEHLILAPPETSTELYVQPGQLELAFQQNLQVYTDLPEWSTNFPGVRFALIEVERSDSSCSYGGYVCYEGCILESVLADPQGHLPLLLEVGLSHEQLHLANMYFNRSMWAK